MDWLQFLEIIAVPAFIGLAALFFWGYRDLRVYIRAVETETDKKQASTTAKYDATITAVRQEIQSMTISIMKQYVPKEDVLRLENRLMDAISKIDEKLERIISK
ncbi:MAG TPA: hypothetical protein VND94_01070 [Terriglobia bacterium]|nr:hypothetical protein [Terriglobia bacterium]